MYVNGKEVERMFCTIPTAGCKLAFSVVSYKGRVNASLVAHPGFLEGPTSSTESSAFGSLESQEFLRAYKSEFDLLLSLARAKAK